jgi:creatinine amidohydrolase/Fe(II)-dependent formamide hydrolase-like protein
LRSDDYPVRLWTVAGLIFGALPLLKKRGLGRLVIGDEYDTTIRLSHQGITHYNGLYDQSRYFDHGLTRYFHGKGWGISQFSLLRPLSELLIQKILVERYPDLHQNQTSCHAAHKEGDKIFPCGRCEKCRRIVGMLTALEADPGRIGYRPDQTAKCLEDLVLKGIHQEKEDQEHLAFLLGRTGMLNRNSIKSGEVKERPWIMKLRFDSERSPVEGIPVDLREPIYNLYLQHSQGSVRRSGRTWDDFDILEDPAMKRPYPFERSKKGDPLARLKGNHDKPIEGRYLLSELTWPEAEIRFQEVDVALLPVGSIEQHGPHLPLDSDAFDAEYLSKKVAEACTEPRPLVLPLIPYGVSYHHEDFSGTISIGPDTLSRLVYEIGMSASRHGVTKLVVINGHGGNSPALHFAAQMINRDAHIFTCVDTGETSDPDIHAFTETPNDVHAGEIETSTTLASRPHLVKKDRMKRFVPRFSNRYLNFSSKRSVGWYAHTSKISSTGVLGDPTKASREKGEQIWELMIKNLVEFVEELKNISMDEIYQKRY